MVATRAVAPRNPYALPGVVRHYYDTHPWVDRYEVLARWIVDALPDHKGAGTLRLLDIGSGGGELALSLTTQLRRQRRPFKATLVEPSRLMRSLRAHARVAADPDVSVCAHSFPHDGCVSEADRFDCVVALLSLHHVPRWRIALGRLLQSSPHCELVVLGTVDGDAMTVGTGTSPRGASADPQAEAFWREYHRLAAELSDEVSSRPSELSPWDYAPAVAWLETRGFRQTADTTLEQVRTLTYRQVLAWIRDGALTSLLAFGTRRIRDRLADQMAAWLDAAGVAHDAAWAFRGRIKVIQMRREASR